MATAEEMLAQALSGNSSGDDTVLAIDWDTRIIDIPSTVKCLGVESDDDVNRINFVMPRHYDNIDLSEFLIHINYLNANAEGDVFRVGDAVVDDDVITFSWLAGRHAMAYKGNVKFNVCLKKIDEIDPSIVTKEINTTIATLPVLEGLETSEAVVQQYADILVQWEQELDNKLNTFNTNIGKAIEEYLKENPPATCDISEEAIKAAVDAYLTENPIEGGSVSVEDIKTAVEAYFTENPVEGGSVSEADIKAAVEAYFTENPPSTGDILESDIKDAVEEYLTENPIEGGSVSEEDIKTAVEAYLTENPIEGGTVSEEDIKDAVEAYFTENPIDEDLDIPTGGEAGQVLVKNSDAEGDVSWVHIVSPEEISMSEIEPDDESVKIWIDPNGETESDDGYELPVASTTTLGGVKVGDGLKITNGVLSLALDDGDEVSY